VSLQCSFYLLYLLAGLAICEDVALSGRLFEECLTSLTSAVRIANSAALSAPCRCVKTVCQAQPGTGHLRRHGLLSHYCGCNKHAAIPIRGFGYVGEGHKAMLLLKQDILTKSWSMKQKA